MGIQLEQKTLNLMRTVGQGFAQTVVEKYVTFASEQVPMTDSDSTGVLWAGGLPIVSSIVVEDGAVKISGHIKLDVLYAGESSVEKAVFEEPRFEILVDMDIFEEKTDVSPVVSLVELSVQKNDLRSLSVKATLFADVVVKSFFEADAAISASPTGMARFYSNKQTFRTESFLLPLSTQMKIRESISTASDSFGMKENSKCSASGVASHVHSTVIDGKVLIDAEIKLQVAYEVDTPDPAVDIVNCDKISIHESIELPDAKKGMKADITLKLADVLIVDAVDDTFEVEALLVVNGFLTELDDVEVISEIVSESEDIVDAEATRVDVDEQVAKEFFNVSIVENVQIDPEIGRKLPYGYNEYIYSSGSVNLVSVETLDDEVVIRGTLTAHLTCSYDDDEGTGQGSFLLDIPIEFSDSLEISGLFEEDRVFVTTKISTLRVERNAPSRLSIEADVEVNVEALRARSIAFLTDADLITPVEIDPCALTFYVCSDGDTLNRVARRYKISPEKLSSANKLDEDADIFVKGQKLFIPNK